ncbi:MAG: sigma-70 family RNA polymerase sigma factor [Chrysiogenetes bacterium]|nr:sigma-70 family RNA polymerase sigma factor [Chrysiogenetes bacterium]
MSASPEGGPDAAALWRAFESQLRGYAARRVKETELDDVVQETFLRIHRALGSGTEVRDLRGWVFQVLRSAIADHHRKRARSREDVAGDGIDDAPAGEGAEGANENERVGGWLPFFIEALPPTQREALRLVEIEGLSQTEAARRLGVPVATLKSRVQRGRKRVRELVQACCALKQDRRGNVIDWERKNPCCD